jgi:hypothetical protein
MSRAAINPEISGKYVHNRIRAHYLELKPDGSYYLFEGSAGITGRYEVHDGDITIISSGSTSQAKIKDGVITDSDGDTWVRVKSPDEHPWELFEAIGWFVILVFLAARIL